MPVICYRQDDDYLMIRLSFQKAQHVSVRTTNTLYDCGTNWFQPTFKWVKTGERKKFRMLCRDSWMFVGKASTFLNFLWSGKENTKIRNQDHYEGKNSADAFHCWSNVAIVHALLYLWTTELKPFQPRRFFGGESFSKYSANCTYSRPSIQFHVSSTRDPINRSIQAISVTPKLFYHSSEVNFWTSVLCEAIRE